MPSETPRLPTDSYSSLLRGPGSDRHMPLFGAEVFEHRHPGPTRRRANLGRVALEFAAVTAFVVVTCLLFVAIA